MFVIELTVPFEENFDWAHQRKLEKNEDLREQCIRNGWIRNVFPIEVRCRGFIAKSNSIFLTNLGLLPSDKRIYIDKIQDKALTASAWIWQSHRDTTIWKSLVLSWDTAGALLASGNDASAPKLCLNPHAHTRMYMGIYKYRCVKIISWILNCEMWVCVHIRGAYGRPHGSPLVWACLWPSSQPLSSPQLSHNDSLWP